MTAGRIEFHPLDISREAYTIVMSEKAKLLFAGGVFYLFACLVLFFARASGEPVMVALGDFAYSATLLLGCQAVAMVACAKALGISTAFLPSALISDRTFWRFVGASVASTTASLLTGLVFIIGAAVIVPAPKLLFSISEPRLFAALALVAGGALAAGWVALKTSLMTSAVLVGEKVSIRASWRRTGGMEFRYLAALVLVSALLIVLQSLGRGYASYMGSIELVVLAELFGTVMRLVLAAVCGALAGLIFARVVEFEMASVTVSPEPWDLKTSVEASELK